MKNTDLRPLMVFHEVTDLTGGADVVIDEVFADGGGPHSVMCRAVGGHGADPEPFQLSVAELLDLKKYTFMPELTVGTMYEKIRYLQDCASKLKRSPGTVVVPKADLARVKLYVDDASLGEYGYREPEGKLCSDLLEMAIHPPSIEAMKRALLSCNGCGALLKLGEMMVCADCDGTQTTPDKDDPTKFHLTFGRSPFQNAQAKALLEKSRRIQLMGRVDELKAALGDAKRGFELELPGQWPERVNVLLEPEPTDPKDWTPRYDYKAKPTSPLSWPEKQALLAADEGAHDAGLVRRGLTPEAPDAALTDPFHELSAVLWFLASLTSDHEPGCIVKDGKGEPCDCDVTLREGDPWRARVRASLSLPAALKARLEKADGDREKAVGLAETFARKLENEQKAKCCIDHAGFTPAQPRCGSCSWCVLTARLEKAETQLKARRVVEVKPVAGAPGPNGDGTVYEFKMPEGHIERLIVVRYKPSTLTPEQMRATSEGLRKKLPGVLVLFAQPNWELTVLELP